MFATAVMVGLIYPFFEGIAWNNRFGVQDWIKASFGENFHDFAGSIVVHAVGGWIGLVAVLYLGARRGHYNKEGRLAAHPPSSIPFLVLGAWILSVGALFVGVIAGALFVQMFTITQNRLKIDDVLGVWPLHGLCGA